MEAGVRLRMAVAKGEMTPEEARAEWAEMISDCDGDESGCHCDKDHDGDHKPGRDEMSREKFGEIAKRLRAKVESGEMSEEDARKRMMNLRKRMGREHQRREGAEDVHHERGGREHHDPEAMMEMMDARLDAAVERGDLTEEQAQEKREHLHKRMEQHRAHEAGCDKDSGACDNDTDE